MPPQSINTAYPTLYVPPTPKSYEEKTIGQKINQAFFITVLFLVFSNSYKLLDNVHFMFTQKSFDFIGEETGKPTMKGYIVSGILFFGAVLWILYRNI
jgi:formate/nitrite transporter FocA (FNT family)